MHLQSERAVKPDLNGLGMHSAVSAISAAIQARVAAVQGSPMENHQWNDLRKGENIDGLQKGVFRPEPLHTRPLPQQPLFKACTQCGTTRTPQWREGPDGPKTLCNACGVKLSRQIKKGAGPRQCGSVHGRPTGSSEQAFYSTHSAGSDAPDELHMHPGQFSPEVFVRVRCPAGTSVRPSSSGFASQIGETSAAAVNLLCLAGGRQKCHDQLQIEQGQDRAPYNVNTDLQHLPVEDALQVIRNDLDRTLRDVHVADTVAAAVAEVLAKKQSLANNAWSRHKRALKRLHDLKASVEVQEEVDWMPQPSKKRQKSF